MSNAQRICISGIIFFFFNSIPLPLTKFGLCKLSIGCSTIASRAHWSSLHDCLSDSVSGSCEIQPDPHQETLRFANYLSITCIELACWSAKRIRNCFWSKHTNLSSWLKATNSIRCRTRSASCRNSPFSGASQSKYLWSYFPRSNKLSTRKTKWFTENLIQSPISSL